MNYEKLESHSTALQSWMDEGQFSGRKPRELSTEYWERGKKLVEAFFAEFPVEDLRNETNPDVRYNVRAVSEVAGLIIGMCIHELMGRTSIN